VFPSSSPLLRYQLRVRREIPQHRSVENAIPRLRYAQAIDPREIQVTGDEDRDELALILVERWRNVDGLLDRDCRRLLACAGGVLRIDIAVL